MNCFLLCRNGVAVVCSVVVADEIISDKNQSPFVTNGLLEFVNWFLSCRNGATVVCSTVVADEVISGEVNRGLFLMGYLNL